MYPLMETDDTITIIRKDEYKVGDIVLYTKKERLILHRIIYKTEEGIYILVGDNAHGYEDQAADFEILGAAEQIIDTNRKEKRFQIFLFIIMQRSNMHMFSGISEIALF